MTAIDWRIPQRKLGKFYAGPVDGDPGPKTWIGLVDFAAPSQPNGSDAVTLRGRKLAEVGAAFGMTTPARIASFLANMAHETRDFTRLREDLYYTTTARIRATWPNRFPTDASAAPFVRNPRDLANKVYATRGGNLGGDDGWRFRGGGDPQLTFRANYRATGAALNLPLEDHPELIEAPAVAIAAALVYWRDNGFNALCDAGNPKRVRAKLNAGNPDYPSPVGWDDVQARHGRILELFHD